MGCQAIPFLPKIILHDNAKSKKCGIFADAGYLAIGAGLR